MDRRRILLDFFGFIISVCIFSISKSQLIPLVIIGRIHGWVFFGYTLWIALAAGFILELASYKDDTFIIMGIISVSILVSGIIIQVLNSFCLSFYGLAVLEVFLFILGVFIGRFILKNFSKKYD